jgi:hypothetical protein
MGGAMTKPDQDVLVSSALIRNKYSESSTKVISGYLEGPYKKEGDNDQEHWRYRLYRRLDLDDYIEFEWHQVKHMANYSVKNANGGYDDPPDVTTKVTVWLDSGAQVSIGSFAIGGPIADLYLPEADVAGSLITKGVELSYYGARSNGGPGCGSNAYSSPCPG